MGCAIKHPAPHEAGALREESMISPSLAVIADIHGNTWALDAVLADIDRRGPAQVVCLGDCAYGSLDPAGTLDRLMARGIPSVSGNQDRIIHSPPPGIADTADQRFIMSQLRPAHHEWLRALPPSLTIAGVFCCHGTPGSDETYLLEQVTAHGVQLADSAAVARQLAGVRETAVVCAHSHVPRVVALPDRRLVVNPGSIGIPAYDEDRPTPHVMEAGSPHARYALLSPSRHGWQVELIAVPYDWEAAARVAEQHGRADRAEWIRTGRATLP
jgi:predicted phosphodiesterase